MDPDMAVDVVAVVVSEAIKAGMDPALVSFSMEVAETGDVTVKAMGQSGTPFEGVIPADAIAAALGMESEGDGSAEGAPAEGQPPPPPAQ